MTNEELAQLSDEQKEGLKKWYQLAINVQDACNLSGVVNSWSQAIKFLWTVSDTLHKGTGWVNSHAINVLFADKAASLAGRDFSQAYSEAKDFVKE